jgi:hypothetical protein
MDRRTFAAAFDKLVNRKNPDGSLKYTPKDVHALRAILLLELARSGLAEELSDSSKQELFLTFKLIGIDDKTDPAEVKGLVEKYFKELEINPEILLEFNDLLVLLHQKRDRVEEVEHNEQEFDRFTEKEGPKAPKVDDPVPEDSTHAQTLTLNLGGKVRI